ncbi:MAG: pilus assembly protein PilP [Thermodesulfobacteriota bacterium]
MRKKLISSLGMICILTFGVGCSESPAPPSPKAKIIRKKIAALPPDLLQETSRGSSESNGEPGDLIAQNTADRTPRDEKTSADPAEKPVPTGVQPTQTVEKSSSEKTHTSDQTRSITSESGTPPDPQEQADTADDLVVSISEIAGEEEPREYIVYARKERIDPFVPLFKEEPETKEPEQKESDGKPKPPPRRLTPLEKLDLSQLKLVGIVRTPRGNKAMVEEASGKGYIIDKGTYIGIHSGQVVEIKKDRIVVEEKDTDPMGKVTVRTREIKFQRPSGDEYYEM